MEVESDILSVAIGCKGYHSRASEYGERAWRASGINVNVVYWDGGMEKEIIKFYGKLNSTIDKNHDEDGYRIDS
jgi:hypothetical protein